MAADPWVDPTLAAQSPARGVAALAGGERGTRRPGGGGGQRPQTGAARGSGAAAIRIDAAQREIGRLRRSEDDGSDRDWQDTPDEIAQAMLRRYPSKAKRVGAAILAHAKATAKKPRAGG
jgi:hypothetical protein